MSGFDALGFGWDRSALSLAVPVHTVRRACFAFHRGIADDVWQATVLEGMPLTFVDVKTLVDGGMLTDRPAAVQDQIRRMANSARVLFRLVHSGQFAMSITTYDRIYPIDAVMERWVQAMDQAACAPVEYAFALFLAAASDPSCVGERRYQSFLLMNGILMSHGIDALSVPASSIPAFHAAMTRFAETRDGTPMMNFLMTCHPAARDAQK